MKKTLLIILLLQIGIVLKSQELRHSKGNQGLDFGYSITKAGSAYSFGYANYLKENMILKMSLNYEKGNIDDLNLKTYMFLPSFDYTFPVLPPVLFINLEGGLMIGRESYNNENFIEERGQIIWGATYGFESEIYLNNNIAFLVNFKQIYALGSELSPHRFQIGGGIRLILK